MENKAGNQFFDIYEFTKLLWSQKFVVMLIVCACVGLAALKARYTPNMYKAAVILVSETGEVSNAISQLATLAGISQTASTSEKDIGLALLESQEFVSGFLIRHGFQKEILAVVGRDEETGEYVYDERIFNPDSGEWTNPAFPTNAWALFSKFSSSIDIEQDPTTGIIKLQYLHYSPEFAASVLTQLVKDLNRSLKNRFENKSNARIAALKDALKISEYKEVQTIIFDLIEKEIKSLALKNDTENYAFEVISPAVPPVDRDRPNRPLFLLIGVLVGMLLSFLYVVIKDNLSSGTIE